MVIFGPMTFPDDLLLLSRLFSTRVAVPRWAALLGRRIGEADGCALGALPFFDTTQAAVLMGAPCSAAASGEADAPPWKRLAQLLCRLRRLFSMGALGRRICEADGCSPLEAFAQPIPRLRRLFLDGRALLGRHVVRPMYSPLEAPCSASLPTDSGGCSSMGAPCSAAASGEADGCSLWKRLAQLLCLQTQAAVPRWARPARPPHLVRPMAARLWKRLAQLLCYRLRRLFLDGRALLGAVCGTCLSACLFRWHRCDSCRLQPVR